MQFTGIEILVKKHPPSAYWISKIDILYSGFLARMAL
jgi:hypothetical protein